MYIVQYITVLFLGGVKFFLAVPLAVQYNFSFWQTFILTCFGGVLGVIIFTYFRKIILKLYYKLFPQTRKKNQKKKSSFRKKIAVKTAKKYGLFGIAILTPIFLSIPLGTFIALHLFPDKKKTLPMLFASVLGWSFILTLIWT